MAAKTTNKRKFTAGQERLPWCPKVAVVPRPNLSIIPQVLPDDLMVRAKQLFFASDVIRYLPPDQNRVVVFGKAHPVPRQQAAYSSPGGLSYTFSGLTVAAHDETEVPLLRELRELVQTRTGLSFNFALINFYRDGQDTVGWHADDETVMVKDSAIASLTLGAERDFLFRMKLDPAVKHKVVLRDNMLCTMLHPTNDEWQHSLPRRARVKQPRVNITFRLFKI